jgi:6-phospho-beta-glucosidase
MKISIWGGSAHSTPALWWCLNADHHLQDMTVVLLGRDPGRLKAVERACRLLHNGADNVLRTSVVSSGRDAQAIAGSDVVLVQVRNGGYAARAQDETFPHRYGVVGDEGLGPGGLAAAIRNWKAVAPALEQVSKHASRSLVLMLSSPVGLLVRAANLGFPKLQVAGICELPWTTLSRTCRVAGIDPVKARFEYFGINHLGWLYGVENEHQHLPASVPLKYLRLHEQRDTVLAEQRRAERPRGKELEEVSRQAFELYNDGNADAVRRAVGLRETPWYRDAVGPLLAGLQRRDAAVPFFVSTRNHGFDHFCRNSDVLEYAHTICEGKLRRMPRRRPVPDKMCEQIVQFVEYERVAADAVLSPSANTVQESLAVHPWTRSSARIREMACDVVQYAQE